MLPHSEWCAVWIFWLLFFVVFYKATTNYDWYSDLIFTTQPVKRTSAIIQRTSRVAYTIGSSGSSNSEHAKNTVAPFAYRYRYQARNGRSYHGTSFRLSDHRDSDDPQPILDVGEEAPVEYLRKHPAVSRLVGFYQEPTHEYFNGGGEGRYDVAWDGGGSFTWAALQLAIVLMYGTSIFRRLQRIRQLTRWRFVLAEGIGEVVAGANGGRYYRYLRFTADNGQQYTRVLKEFTRTSEGGFPLFYDPARPTRTTLVDERWLPENVMIGEHGHLQMMDTPEEPNPLYRRIGITCLIGISLIVLMQLAQLGRVLYLYWGF